MRKFLIALLALLALPALARAEQVNTSARSCVVIDAESGRILLEHNAHEALPMASTTKVMTALLALENGDLDAPVTCSRTAFGVPGTSIYLGEGETLTLEQMLYGLMLASGNDAATAIAEHIGGTVDDFCRLMTLRARELGCENTVFLTPHGLPREGHYTTASDLALIAREAMRNSVFRRIVSTSRAKIPWEGRTYDRALTNKNKLLTTYEGATGIKTGYTKAAGRCLVFGAERNGMEVIGVVLCCGDWFDEAARLMDITFDHYERATLMLKGDPVRGVDVHRGLETQVQTVLGADVSAVVPKGTSPGIEIVLPEMLEAPVSAGQTVGYARIMVQGEETARVPIVAQSDVMRDDFAWRWQNFIYHWLLLTGVSRP